MLRDLSEPRVEFPFTYSPQTGSSYCSPSLKLLRLSLQPKLAAKPASKVKRYFSQVNRAIRNAHLPLAVFSPGEKQEVAKGVEVYGQFCTSAVETNWYGRSIGWHEGRRTHLRRS